jgi:hypothetical protein
MQAFETCSDRKRSARRGQKNPWWTRKLVFMRWWIRIRMAPSFRRMRRAQAEGGLQEISFSSNHEQNLLDVQKVQAGLR